jgi:hypothetical protein
MAQAMRVLVALLAIGGSSLVLEAGRRWLI